MDGQSSNYMVPPFGEHNKPVGGAGASFCIHIKHAFHQ